MNQRFKDIAKYIKEPTMTGSYSSDDCVFLLKDIGNMIQEQSNEFREKAIQSGTHYSEMLPIEYTPKEDYTKFFLTTLEENSYKIAKYVSIIAELIVHKKGKDVILASLARAGTPIGVLIKRYIQQKYHVNVPHYSISIIRDKGIDENALIYMINKHQSANIQFVDGWTGKGVINKVLADACQQFESKYDIRLDSTLSVLADPASCVSMHGTREDFLIPSACLNSTVSGLVSRTFLSPSVIGEHDYHGAKYYQEWINIDYTNHFIQEVIKHFDKITINLNDLQINDNIYNFGLQDVYRIKDTFQINDVNLIKPGVGETTRILLRRVPWKILVNDIGNPNLKHIILLAKEKNVPVEEYKDMSYACCGIIKTIDQ